ncbi:hypothetical protein KBX50_05075 [Micromonospora sp. C51]|uniref:hypothetical protein n=1 Tax=Micromonospora sp. C51 TaxID=2824879 RepID=UPI001B363E7C|nr:hypothetical protein [Micromonospora sp. C51]MBQ1047830.1 hypothetical protein [Micromonospora sp. C51]
MSQDDSWLSRAVMDLLACAATGDTAGVRDALEAIVRERNASGVWALCCAMADTVTTLGLGVRQGEGFAAVQLATGSGEPVEPENWPPQARPQLWATRFVAAHVNGDMDTSYALFLSTMPDPQQHMAGVAALIGLAGRVVRADLHRKMPGAGHEC